MNKKDKQGLIGFGLMFLGIGVIITGVYISKTNEAIALGFLFGSLLPILSGWILFGESIMLGERGKI